MTQQQVREQLELAEKATKTYRREVIMAALDMTMLLKQLGEAMSQMRNIHGGLWECAYCRDMVSRGYGPCATKKMLRMYFGESL